MPGLTSSLFRAAICLLAAAALLFLPLQPKAQAHAYSAAYTTLELTKHETGLTYAIDELSVIELTKGDTNGNGMLDQDEFETIKPKFEALLQANFSLVVNGQTLPLEQIESFEMNRQGEATKATLKAVFPAVASSSAVSLSDKLYLGDTKSNYVDLLTIHYGPQSSTAALSGPDRTWIMQLAAEDYDALPADLSQVQQAAPDKNGTSGADNGSGSSSSSWTAGWYSFFKLGMHHILGGYDHLLFLFSLLIARQSFKQYATMITAFTIAHSCTLTLTVLGIIDVPSSIVEPAIALSICYVALDNIVRPAVSHRWVLTFLFGLIHGMGFADIMKDMDIPKHAMAADLISFNLGIETIQLTIVGIFVPLLYLMHRYKYARRFVVAGSSLALLLGGIWLIERVFAV